MKRLLFIAGCLLALGSLHAQVDHRIWDQLLQAHVSPAGMVDYTGFHKDQARLQAYLETLSQHPPQTNWASSDRLAYWINAYNAFTVQLILDHYPLKSIRDLEKPWDQSFIELGGKTYSLNDIEHGILRKRFEEPRIHFAVNCASVSCPLLLNRAYTPAQLEEQLERQARHFINDPAYNQLSQGKLSSLFDWYAEDFTQEGSLIAYLNRYAKAPLPPETEVSFLPYNWNLNKQ
jgi:hypothetical protein